jgi:uncharacterized protein YjbJ (UPF0337 family)
MSEHDIEGERKQAKGKAQEEAAEVTGDTSEKMKAKSKQAEGKIQEEWGEATD